MMKSFHHPDIDILHRVSGLWEQTARSIGDDLWSLPTPCTDWDVGQLADHVIGGNWFTIAILEGQSADAAMTSAIESFTGHVDRVASVAASTAAQRDLFSTAGVLGGRYSHTAGDLTGAEVLRLRLHDLIIHHWDLEQAVSPPAGIADDLLSWSMSDLAMPDSLAARHFELPTVPAGGPDPQGRLLAAFGRRT